MSKAKGTPDGAPSTLRALMRSGPAAQLVTLITLYRTITFPLLLTLVFTGQADIFKWFLTASFLTDAVDGYLARKYKVTSILGAKLDSIGDDLTVLAGLCGLFVFHLEFVKEQLVIFSVALGLFFTQLGLAVFRYGKFSSFHTYLAKISAVLQGFFLCSMFLFDHPAYWLFYMAAITTCVELLEEIVIVIVLPEWTVNVKGLYWVLKRHST